MEAGDMVALIKCSLIHATQNLVDILYITSNHNNISRMNSGDEHYKELQKKQQQVAMTGRAVGVICELIASGLLGAMVSSRLRCGNGGLLGPCFCTPSSSSTPSSLHHHWSPIRLEDAMVHDEAMMVEESD